MKEILKIAGIKESSSPFSHVVRSANMLYITSQLSCDLKTGEILKGDIETQTKNALDNLKYILENSDSSLKNVLRIAVYIRKLSDFNGMNKIYKKYFPRNEEPIRVIIQAVSPIDGIDIEIEAEALSEK